VIDLARVYFFAFEALTIAGGVIGYVKARSSASIVAGTVFGAILVVASAEGGKFQQRRKRRRTPRPGRPGEYALRANAVLVVARLRFAPRRHVREEGLDGADGQEWVGKPRLRPDPKLVHHLCSLRAQLRLEAPAMRAWQTDWRSSVRVVFGVQRRFFQ
jgi:uncharacterized membrane protein (UPF0136 family)